MCHKLHIWCLSIQKTSSRKSRKSQFVVKTMKLSLVLVTPLSQANISGPTRSYMTTLVAVTFGAFQSVFQNEGKSINKGGNPYKSGHVDSCSYAKGDGLVLWEMSFQFHFFSYTSTVLRQTAAFFDFAKSPCQLTSIICVISGTIPTGSKNNLDLTVDFHTYLFRNKYWHGGLLIPYRNKMVSLTIQELTPMDNWPISDWPTWTTDQSATDPDGQPTILSYAKTG